MYAKVKNGIVEKYPYTVDDLRRDNPNTSFPVTQTAELLSEFGVVTVVVTGKPEHNYTQNCIESDPVFVQDRNRWEQNWVITEASEQEIVDRINAKSGEIRADRNAKLSSCDWTQLPDAPVDSFAWAAYRQELRDISSQAGFPWEVVWPQEP